MAGAPECTCPDGCAAHPVVTEDPPRDPVAAIRAANAPKRPRDPEGMGADTWRPFP